MATEPSCKWQIIKQVTEFRSVTTEDLKREKIVFYYVTKNLSSWQDKGYLPDIVMMAGN